MAETTPSLLVVSAHAGDFVWRAGGAIAAATMRGERAVIVCLSYGERGESASQWLQGKPLDEIKAIRRDEAAAAAAALGAEIEFLDLGDYPLIESAEAVQKLVDVYRRVQPTVVLTHPLADPYNGDHPAAGRMALQARVLAQAIGVANSDGTYPTKDEIIGAPPVFFFEPHQPEQCDFKPNVLLDITEAFPLKQKAMECLPAQKHMWDYYTSLAIRRGVQVKRNAGPNLGLPVDTMGEAYVRYYPHVTDVLGMSHVIVTDIERADAAAIDALAVHGVATVHEAMGRVGLVGTSVHPLQEGSRIAGSAVTVLCWPGDNLMIHAAVEQCRAGDILVVTTVSPSLDGSFGELFATALQHRGVRGLVTTGGVRDAVDLRAMGFPVWSAAVNAQGTVKATPGSVNVPITVGGAIVRAGDVIVADDDGVVCVPRQWAAATLAASDARVAKEAESRAAYQEGQLSLDRNALRPVLADLGVVYITAAEFEAEHGRG